MSCEDYQNTEMYKRYMEQRKKEKKETGPGGAGRERTDEERMRDLFIGLGLDQPLPEYRPSKLERFREKAESICGPVLLILGTIGVGLVLAQTALLILGKLQVVFH